MCNISPDEIALKTYDLFRPLTLAEQRLFVADPNRFPKSKHRLVFSPQLKELYYEQLNENPAVEPTGQMVRLLRKAIPDLPETPPEGTTLLIQNTLRYLHCKASADRILAFRQRLTDQGYRALTGNDLLYLANTGLKADVCTGSDQAFTAVLMSDMEGNHHWQLDTTAGKRHKPSSQPVLVGGTFIRYTLPPVTTSPTKGLYTDLILSAVPGCSLEVAGELEEIMRHDVFHSTLDWLEKEELQQGALEAWAIYNLLKTNPNHVLSAH